MKLDYVIEEINKQIIEAYKAGFIQGQIGNGALRGRKVEKGKVYRPKRRRKAS